jgi:twitching motility protein PilT
MSVTSKNKTLSDYFQIAVDKKASDIHLIAHKPPVIRVARQLLELDSEEVMLPELIEKLIKNTLNEQQFNTFVKDRELDISYELPDNTRMRVNLHFEKNYMGLVARVVPSQVPNMKSILMPEVIYDITREQQGLILVTGPTGCGKSTSLAAMIDLINSERSVNIITLEDPIEFIYKPKKSIIRQRQLGSDMLSFQSALKHVLRQDPDVVMVGEMRDLETIAATITLAETGHLVLATLHTLNAAQTIDRVIDVFPPYQQPQVRLQLSMSLKGIISQRLLPTKEGGLIAAREVLMNTPAVANLIRENKIPQIKTIIQTSAKEGMVTMDQDLKRLYNNDTITREEARKYMIDPHSLK